MIGENYLRRCEWLSSALGQMLALGTTLEADPIYLDAVRTLARRVREPLLFLVAGPTGAGKTTLINALAGEAFANGERDERRTRWYRHGAEASDRNRWDHVLECARPSPELEQLQLVEMPAPGGWPELRPAILGEIFGTPDAVLFVLPLPDPWDDQMWEFLRQMHALCPEKLICVLQQKDLRSAMEAETVAQHVEQKIRDQFGAPGRVVPLAANQVLPAYASNEEDGSRLLEECGYLTLERQLSEVLSHNEPRLCRLLEVTEEARRVLGQLSAKTNDKFQILSRDAQRLGTLGRDVAGGKSDTVQHLTGTLLGLTRACDQAQRRSLEHLEKELAPSALFLLPFRGLQTVPGTQVPEDAGDLLRQTIRPEAQRSLEDLEHNFKGVWRHFHDTLQTDFSTPLPPAPYDPPPVRKREELLARIEREAFDQNPHPDVANTYWSLHGMMVGLRIFLLLIVLTLGGCIAFALAEQADNAVIIGLVAVALIASAIIFATLRRKKLLLENLHRLTLSREAAITAAETNLHTVVDQFYADVNMLFEPLESFCLARKEFFQPFIEQSNALSSRLERSAKALRMELGL